MPSCLGRTRASPALQCSVQFECSSHDRRINYRIAACLGGARQRINSFQCSELRLRAHRKAKGVPTEVEPATTHTYLRPRITSVCASGRSQCRRMRWLPVLEACDTSACVQRFQVPAVLQLAARAYGRNGLAKNHVSPQALVSGRAGSTCGRRQLPRWIYMPTSTSPALASLSSPSSSSCSAVASFPSSHRKSSGVSAVVPP